MKIGIDARHRLDGTAQDRHPARVRRVEDHQQQEATANAIPHQYAKATRYE